MIYYCITTTTGRVWKVGKCDIADWIHIKIAAQQTNNTAHMIGKEIYEELKEQIK